MNEHILEFIKYLDSLDAGALATLRQNTGQRVYKTGSLLWRWLPDPGMSWRNQCYLNVAVLFATHKLNTFNEHFATSMSKILVTDSGSNECSAKDLLITWLDSSGDGVFNHLSGLIQMARNHPLNWAELLYYLCNWNSQDAWAQNKIAREFWEEKV